MSTVSGRGDYSCALKEYRTITPKTEILSEWNVYQAINNYGGNENIINANLVLIMDTGQKLRDLTVNPFSNLECVKYASQLASAVEFMHKVVGYAHRDIKPDNIVFVGDTLKLCDMGTACEIKKNLMNSEKPTDKFEFVGTTRYRAPESCNDMKQQYYVSRLDVWSLGCVILHFATGSEPWGNFIFQRGPADHLEGTRQYENIYAMQMGIIDAIKDAGENQPGSIYDKVYEAHTKNPITPKCVENVVKKCLTYTNLDRPDASWVRGALDDCMDEEPALI